MISNWNFKEESYGPLLPFVKDPLITDINYNGSDVWLEHLEKGRYKADVQLTPEFVQQFSVHISNVVSEQLNKFNNVLEAETETLRISIIHPSVTDTGYSISIRKTPAVIRLHEDEMLKQGYFTKPILAFLKNCIKANMNLVFCGTPGAVKQNF